MDQIFVYERFLILRDVTFEMSIALVISQSDRYSLRNEQFESGRKDFAVGRCVSGAKWPFL